MRKRLRRFLRIALLVYLALLTLSHLKRWLDPVETEPGSGQSLLSVEGFGEDSGKSLAIAVRDLPAQEENAPTLLLIHGSPVGSAIFDPLIGEFEGKFHTLAPDLPGHGNSTHRVEDGSFRADADYLRQILDRKNVAEAHFVAYSRGGGPALVFAEKYPGRVASLTLLSSIGVQEQELLGNHTLNHALHSLQLGFFTLLEELVPHFGYLDNAILNTDYARSFSDADQRPLREYLFRLQGPVLIIHGKSDALVPAAAAREHHRIVPQSRLEMMKGGHLLPLRKADAVARKISTFTRDAENGVATLRRDASPTRLLAASEQGADSPAEPETGSGLVFLALILFFSTFASEDLTCVVAGILAAAGTLPYPVAVLICFGGILFGDLIIFFGGRLFGARAVRHIPFRWVLSERHLRRTEEWFAKRGGMVIVTARFLPGSRLAVYFAAGVAKASVAKFLFFFTLAAAVWTPLIVGLAMLLGNPLLHLLAEFEEYALLGLVALLLVFLVFFKAILPMSTHRGRRILKGRWKRLTRWEFWPRWFFYPPVVLWVIWLGLRYRKPSLFTAVNPALPAGGIAFESKQAIYRQLRKGRGRLAATLCLDRDAGIEHWMSRATAFQNELPSPFPIVCKPDAGERGDGVEIVTDEHELRAALERNAPAPILQEFVPGLEFGIFYERPPGTSRGRVTSITRKIHLSVTGDGQRTLEELILDDDRAVCMYPYFRDKHWDHLDRIPAAGESVEIAPLGTHCRGSLFLDGCDLHSEALDEAVDRIFQGTQGLQFGRLDLKCPSEEDLQQGKNLTVLEFNGLSSEPTHIYDPRHSLWNAYRTIFAQWSRAFAIAAANRAAGHAPWSARSTLRLLFSALGGKSSQ